VGKWSARGEQMVGKWRERRIVTPLFATGLRPKGPALTPNPSPTGETGWESESERRWKRATPNPILSPET